MSIGVLQIEGLEGSKQALADEALMGKQQIEYLQQQLGGCQQELTKMQVTFLQCMSAMPLPPPAAALCPSHPLPPPLCSFYPPLCLLLSWALYAVVTCECMLCRVNNTTVKMR